MATNNSEQHLYSSINQADEQNTCKICGDTATRCNFGVISCVGCRQFFHRTVKNFVQYECFDNKSCDITIHTRTRCKHCRFQKCLQVGMCTTKILNPSERIAREKLIEENRNKLLAENTPEPVPVYSEVDVEFLTDVTTASDLAFGSNKSLTFGFPHGCERREIIRKSLLLSTERAYDFLSNISFVKQMSRTDISQFTRSRVLPVVYMRSILLFPRHEKLIQSNESIISQSGLTYLMNSFQTFSNQLQQLEFKPEEFILLPLYGVFNDNQGDGDVNQSPIVKNICERVRSHLSNRWFLPEQQVLLNLILQLSSKHEENINKLKVDVPNFQLMYTILMSNFDISVQ